MSGFSAVVTTGIYCRPGCSARPLPRNVRHFDLAASAEAAGFRACLKCRPYRSTQSNGVAGPDLICRGVRLIIDGALDDGTEADLGARLGVSARHLRRLFVEHAGVTPDQLARSRRAHFARRLLDDTDLPISQVAFASGFGSERQFNRACIDIFRAPASELRARRRSADRLVADGGLALRLSFDGPLDWTAMLRYFAARAIPGVERVAGNTYRRTVTIDGDPGVLELSLGAPDHLVLRAHLPQWEGLIHVVERARRIFNLDGAHVDATNHLADDPLVGPLVRARPGLRVPGTWDPVEIGVRAIVGQQISVAGANTIIARVVERHGDPVTGLSTWDLTHVFPTPATLADADLDGLGLTAARAAAVRGFATAVAKEEVRLDRGAGLDELVTSIAALPGLGPWTAHYVALRLGEADAFPGFDLGLRRAIERLITPSGAPVRDATSVADAWRPWRALAAVHLWQG
jgi:AraC family transcriptional regulator of adaptative response / DNA-3-methyladenine glycosylase II